MTEDDLLDAIAEAPNDDGPRLVYADWLQMQDDEHARGRGEYIALNCSTVRPKPAQRIQELLDKHGAAWLGPVALVTESRMWSRGFLDSCEIRENTFQTMAEAVLDHREWRMLRALYADLRSEIPSPEQLGRLICQRALAGLRALRTTLPVLRLMAESMLAPRIVELGFAAHGGEGSEQLAPLLHADCFRRVRKLSMVRLAPSVLPPLMQHPLEIIAVCGPPRSIVGWIGELAALRAPLSEFRVASTYDDIFDRRQHELVLFGNAGRWTHLEIRWPYEDLRDWRDEVIGSLSTLPRGTIERLTFIGPANARFDVARFQHRVRAVLPTVDD